MKIHFLGYSNREVIFLQEKSTLMSIIGMPKTIMVVDWVSQEGNSKAPKPWYFQKGSAYFVLLQLQSPTVLSKDVGACQIRQSAGISLGDGEYFFLLLISSFISPSQVLTSAAVMHRGLDNLGKGKEENKGCFGYFTNETKTNKKPRNRTDLGSNLFMSRQRFIQKDSF